MTSCTANRRNGRSPPSEATVQSPQGQFFGFELYRRPEQSLSSFVPLGSKKERTAWPPKTVRFNSLLRSARIVRPRITPQKNFRSRGGGLGLGRGLTLYERFAIISPFALIATRRSP